jgi:hypothetical protein
MSRQAGHAQLLGLAVSCFCAISPALSQEPQEDSTSRRIVAKLQVDARELEDGLHQEGNYGGRVAQRTTEEAS